MKRVKLLIILLCIRLLRHLINSQDPKKRDFIFSEILKTRQNIHENFLSERVGDVNIQYQLSKLFKPVTDMQKDLKEGLLSELKPIREGIKNLTKTITFQTIFVYNSL